MLASRLGLLAAAALVAGTAGCSLPEVLPLAGGTTSGPSPYGVWYEQHWATNSVLLAAADQPEGELPLPDEADLDAAATGDDLGSGGTQPETLQPDDAKAPVEASAGNGDTASDFDNSTPYQFPASAFSGAPERSTEIPNDDLKPAAPKPAEPKSAPSGGGPIRY